MIIVAFANAFSAVKLVLELLHGLAGDNPAALLGTGAAIYVTNVIVFALWYWAFDRGGPLGRAAAASEPVAAGIQPVGDALCHTNPTFAYGAVLSIQHGFTLAGIAGRTEDPRARALAFDDAVGPDAAARFDAVSAEDRDRLRLWRGEPINVREPGDSIALFLRMTAYPAAAHDAGLFRAVARRVNMLDPPGKLEHDAALIARAQHIARDAAAPPPGGPARPELLAAIQPEPTTA